MSLSTDWRFRTLKQGDHVCAVYKNFDAQAEAIVDYFKTGLLAGDRCIYYADERPVQDIYNRLSKAGVDVATAQSSRKLSIRASDSLYFECGEFNPDRVIDGLRAEEKAALSDGCSGLRLTGEMSWASKLKNGRSRLFEYESQWNSVVGGSHTQGICQYDESLFSASAIEDVLRTHPIVCISQSACLNPYYEPPGEPLPANRARDPADQRVQRMMQRLLEFRRMEQSLQQQIRERDEFLSAASRELRSPLHALNLSLHVVSRQMGADDTPTKKHLARVQRQVERLNRLISVMLDAACIREGRLQWHFESFDLLQLAKVTVGYFEHEAQYLGYAVQVSGDSVWGHWDTERINQILHNLIGNAIKFGVSKQIEVNVTADADFAHIAVIDRGINLDVEDEGHIFKRLQHASVIGGNVEMGLGLWIVGKLVEAMRGVFEVQSKPGEGARFLVRLPLNC